MAPFMHADGIKDPILFIHGTEDNNSGTFPMQSERMYAAVSGLGGITRLVMLPEESHGYSARESVLHMHWEKADGLNRHVRDRYDGLTLGRPVSPGLPCLLAKTSDLRGQVQFGLPLTAHPGSYFYQERSPFLLFK